MGFQDGVLKQAKKIAWMSPEEIRERIAQEEIEGLERMKALAEAAGEYLEGESNPATSKNASISPVLNGSRSKRN